MKRMVLMSILLGLLCASMLWAQDDDSFRLQTKVGIAGSVVATYITPDVTLLYNPSFFGFGGGLKTFWGTRYGDAYIAPYGTFELWWLYVNLGVSIQIKQSNELLARPSSKEPPIYLSTGMYPKIKTGPGWLVFGGNVDVIATDSPIIEGDNFLETLILTSMGAMLGFFKVEAGIGYRIPI